MINISNTIFPDSKITKFSNWVQSFSKWTRLFSEFLSILIMPMNTQNLETNHQSQLKDQNNNLQPWQWTWHFFKIVRLVYCQNPLQKYSNDTKHHTIVLNNKFISPLIKQHVTIMKTNFVTLHLHVLLLSGLRLADCLSSFSEAIAKMKKK